MLEINLFTIGDSNDIRTWSNVPYFLAEAFLKQGVKVNRIDISEYRLAKILYTYYFELVKRLFRTFGYNKEVLPFFITYINHRLTNMHIKKSLKKYPQSELNVFLTYSFSSYKYSHVPVVHYCDMVYEQFLNENRIEKNRIHKNQIEREKLILKNATHVISCNKNCYEFIKNNYDIRNVEEFIGGINLHSSSLDVDEIIELKKTNYNILFIGRGVYKRGVDILVDAFKKFNSLNKNKFILHLVGISEHELNQCDSSTRYYPYLNKGCSEELKTYMDLLHSARLFVMPMRQGPPPGAAREASLCFTPVIISNIWDAEVTVRTGVNGILVDRIEPEEFANQMDRVIKDEPYWEQLARQAPSVLQKYSWDRTARHLLNLIPLDRGNVESLDQKI